MRAPRPRPSAPRGSRPSNVAALVLVAVSVVACNLLTGSSAYEKTDSCTGPTCGKCAVGEYINSKGACTPCLSGENACGQVCCASAQTCVDASKGLCGCDPNAGAAGDIVCGSTCCSVLTPYCVEVDAGESEKTLRCSACEKADRECGEACCLEGQTCVDRDLGVCEGAPFGVSKQSCSGLPGCPLTDSNGGMVMADCCESITVPESTFLMGGDPEKHPPMGDEYDWPQGDTIPFPASASTYALDRFEVTVGRFRKFVEAYETIMPGGFPDGVGRNPNVSVRFLPRGSGWQQKWNKFIPQSKVDLETQLTRQGDCTYKVTPGENDLLPVNCVTWFEAFAFCAWDGGWLPTEAEWEMAATNGDANTIYAWGDAPGPDDTRAVYCSDEEEGCALLPSPVGTKPAGANFLGHHDLAGNIAEWVLDGLSTYPTSEKCGEPCRDYARPGDDFCHVIRSGAYDAPYPYLRASTRGCDVPIYVDEEYGLRCARKADAGGGR
jgi:formylglycine-generating enzyme